MQYVIVCHEIKLKPDFVQKQSKVYLIPEVLKPEVQRETDELMQDGFLVPSESNVESDIVCTYKQQRNLSHV